MQNESYCVGFCRIRRNKTNIKRFTNKRLLTIMQSLLCIGKNVTLKIKYILQHKFQFFMKKLLLLLSIWLYAGSIFAQNFPFPQAGSLPYANGIIATNPDNNKIQSLYESWKSKFYTEEGNLARIKFDNTAQTVSEGIGYGMLIFVYMENTTNQTQDEFDKLYNYYNKFGNYGGNKYLMDWKIDGFTSVNSGGEGSATDGDLDVALALLLAHKQWGSNGTIDYIGEAETLLTYIYDQQVDGQQLLKPGHQWNNEKNPCYFTTASIGLFDQAQNLESFSSKRNWAGVYSTSQTYLTNSQSDKGLYPDWTTPSLDPTPSSGTRGNFSWDACRTPWRIAWDYAWYGNSKALAMLNKTIAFNETLTASTAVGPLTLSGTGAGETFHNSAFIGGLGAAYMAADLYQSDLDTWYNELKNMNEGYGYYAPTLQVLYLLTLSGNSPNFYDAGTGPVAPRLGTATNSPTAPSELTLVFSKDLASVSSSVKSSFTAKINGSAVSVSSLSYSASTPNTIVLTLGTTVEAGDEITLSYSGSSIKSKEGATLESFSNTSVANTLTDGFVLSDSENGEYTNLKTSWYTYTDNDAGGNTTVDPLTTDTDPFTMSAGGAAGTANAAKIEFKIDNGSLEYDGFAGLGFALMEDETAYDLSEATGIAFWHKGSNCYFEVQLSTITDDCNFNIEVSSHDEWTLIEVPFSDLAQYTWGKVVAWDASKVTKLQWKPQKANSTATEELWIDEVVALGMDAVVMVNKSELTALIATVKDFLADAEEGSADGQYPAGSKKTLQDAVDAAQTLVDDQSATQDAVNGEVDDLNAAFSTFKKSVIGVNKSDLKLLITKVETFLSKAVEGTEYGQYPAGSKKILQDAADAAQAVVDNSSASQSTVDTEESDLQKAFDAFKDKVNNVDKSALKTLITEATNFLSTAVEGTAPGTYPAGSKTSLQSVIDAAQSVVDNASATQANVNESKANLESALANFKASVNKEQAYVAEMLADNENDNTTNLGTSWYSFNDNSSGGASTVDPLTTETNPFTMTAGGADGTDQAAKIDFTIDNGSLAYEGFVGIGFPFNEDESAYDLSKADGFSFWHKGSACYFEVQLTSITDDCNFNYAVPQHTNWTKVEVKYEDLAQYTWGKVVTADWSLLKKLQWKPQKANSTASEELWIDEVKTLGGSSDGTLDKSALDKLITSVETALNSAVAGSEAGQYPQSAITDLETALDAAKNVSDNSTDQTEVNGAKDALQQALTLFNAAVVAITDNSITLEIFPNPVSKSLKVKTSALQNVTVYSLQSVKMIEVSTSEFDVSYLAPGVYILVVETENGTASERFVKN